MPKVNVHSSNGYSLTKNPSTHYNPYTVYARQGNKITVSVISLVGEGDTYILKGEKHLKEFSFEFVDGKKLQLEICKENIATKEFYSLNIIVSERILTFDFRRKKRRAKFKKVI